MEWIIGLGIERERKGSVYSRKEYRTVKNDVLKIANGLHLQV